MKTIFPRKPAIVEKADLVYLSRFDYLPSVWRFTVKKLLMLICMIWTAGYSPLVAQPLSALQDGRVITVSWQNEFWPVFEDDGGYLWGYNSEFEIVRFDGVEHKKFISDPGNPHSIRAPGPGIPYFLEDADGKIWINIYSRIEKFDPETEKFEHIEDDFLTVDSAGLTVLYHLFQDTKGNIWFSGQSNLFVLASDDDKIHRISGDYVNSSLVFEEKNGGIWFFSNYQDTLCKADVNKFEITDKLQVPYGGGFPPSMDFNFNANAVDCSDLSNTKMILLNGELWLFNSEFKKIEKVTQGLEEKEIVYSICADNHNIIIGTSKHRLLQFNQKSKVFSLFTSLPDMPTEDDPILKLFLAKNGILWVTSTKKTYLVLPKNSPIKKMKLPDDIRPFSPIGGLQHQLLSFQGEVYYFTKKELKPVLKNTNVKSISLEFNKNGNHSNDGDMLENLVTNPYNNFLFKEDKRRNTLCLLIQDAWKRDVAFFQFQKDGKQVDYFYCNNQDSIHLNTPVLDFDVDEKGKLWVASWNGFFRFDPGIKQLQRIWDKEKTNSSYLTNNYFTTVLADKDEQIWIGYHKHGLSRLNPNAGGFTHFGKESEDESSTIIDSYITEIISDNEDQVWISSEQGISCWNPSTRKFIDYSSKDNLPAGIILSLISDNKGRIWATTKEKLCMLEPGKRFFHIFDELAGLPNTTFMQSSSYSDHKGNLFFTATDGITYFHPDSVQLDTVIPRLIFTDFQVSDQSVKVGDSTGILSKSIAFTEAVTLKYEQNVFTIHYTAFEFLHPDETTFAFQLEDFDPDWRYVGNLREATYTNLPSGDYLFKVKCRNHHGFWGDPITLHIHVQPPWYRTWLAYLTYVLLGGSLLLALRRYELNRQLARAEARRLQELDQLKTRLYTNITHEFRTPLTVINGMADRLQGQVDFAAREGLQLIKRNGRQLLDLVNQILDLAKLESGSLAVNMVQGDVIVFIKYLLESFHSLADGKNILLDFRSSEAHFNMDFDAEKLRQIMSNLLQNAIKFTPDGGTVTVAVSLGMRDEERGMKNSAVSTLNPHPSSLILQVTDTGRGIPPDQLDKIFDRFHQVDPDSYRDGTHSGEGTGIGLTLTRELVKLLGGQINVESKLGVGTQFTVVLPVSRKAESVQPESLKVPEIPVLSESLAPQQAVASSSLIPHSSFQKNLPSLLIIEDNHDVVQYVSLVLKNDYHLLTASDGKSGLETALAELPDLIISDVMMPEMGGYEVCRRLKNDLATSHIPVVLLTAKADFESRMEGLELGADAYLAKPFEEKELKIVLKKLLENRERVRQYYTSGEFLKKQAASPGAEVSLSPKDREFLERLIEAVEANLSDPRFTAEALSDLLFLSYGTCLRKVKALTGMSVSEYIQHVRINKAAQLLREDTSRPVAEIAEASGYGSPSYFNRVFKNAMGCTPGEYRKKAVRR